MSYRKVYEVVGYTYEADTHCLDCTTKRFAVPGEDGPEIIDDTPDNEGNPIHPIFLGDEFDYTPFCGTCHMRIDDGLSGILERNERAEDDD